MREVGTTVTSPRAFAYESLQNEQLALESERRDLKSLLKGRIGVLPARVGDMDPRTEAKKRVAEINDRIEKIYEERRQMKEAADIVARQEVPDIEMAKDVADLERLAGKRARILQEKNIAKGDYFKFLELDRGLMRQRLLAKTIRAQSIQGAVKAKELGLAPEVRIKVEGFATPLELYGLPEKKSRKERGLEGRRVLPGKAVIRVPGAIRGTTRRVSTVVTGERGRTRLKREPELGKLVKRKRYREFVMEVEPERLGKITPKRKAKKLSGIKELGEGKDVARFFFEEEKE